MLNRYSLYYYRIIEEKKSQKTLSQYKNFLYKDGKPLVF